MTEKKTSRYGGGATKTNIRVRPPKAPKNKSPYPRLIGSILIMVVGLILCFKAYEYQSKFRTSFVLSYQASKVTDEMKTKLSNPEVCKSSLFEKNGNFNQIAKIDYLQVGTPIVEEEDEKLFLKDIIIDGQDSGFKASTGRAVLKFIWGDKASGGKKLVTFLPLQITVNDLGKIQTCHTLPGLRSGFSPVRPKGVWSKSQEGDNLFRLQGNLSIGEVENRGRLNVEGGIGLIQYGLGRECSGKGEGTFLFNVSDQSLNFCLSENHYEPLFGGAGLVTEKKGITVVMSGNGSQTKTTDDEYKFCEIVRSTSQGGKCLATSPGPHLSKGKWKLTATNYRGETTLCEFVCRN